MIYFLFTNLYIHSYSLKPGDIDGENKISRDDLKGSLAESVPKVLYQAMPVIWMLPKKYEILNQ